MSCSSCGQGVKTAPALKEGLCANCRTERSSLLKCRKAEGAIKQLLDRDDVLILDTETTGMGKQAEVIEVSVMNTRGDVLLDSLVKPKASSMNPYAQRVHKISMTMLKDAPSWPEVFPKLAELADRRTVLAWNASFDAGVLEQTSQLWNIAQPRWLFVCAMRLYAQRRGLRRRALHKALYDEQLETLLERYQSHRALADVRFVLEVLKASVS